MFYFTIKAATHSSRTGCSFLTNIKLYINYSLKTYTTLLYMLLCQTNMGSLLVYSSGMLRHRTILGTNVGTHLNGKFVSLLDALALQDAGTESTGEAITCTYGISHLNLWSLLE